MVALAGSAPSQPAEVEAQPRRRSACAAGALVRRALGDRHPWVPRGTERVLRRDGDGQSRRTRRRAASACAAIAPPIGRRSPGTRRAARRLTRRPFPGQLGLLSAALDHIRGKAEHEADTTDRAHRETADIAVFSKTPRVSCRPVDPFARGQFLYRRAHALVQHPPPQSPRHRLDIALSTLATLPTTRRPVTNVGKSLSACLKLGKPHGRSSRARFGPRHSWRESPVPHRSRTIGMTIRPPGLSGSQGLGHCWSRR